VDYAAQQQKIGSIEQFLLSFYTNFKKQIQKQLTFSGNYGGLFVQKNKEGKIQLKILNWEELVEGNIQDDIAKFKEYLYSNAPNESSKKQAN
jgi:hypothetical protein